MKEKKFAARNLSMLIDFYELTMANGYFQSGRKDTVAVFDMFFRKIPDNGGFAIFAGLEQLIDYKMCIRDRIVLSQLSEQEATQNGR